MSAGGASRGTMPPGWFVIESALDPNLVLDVPFAIKDAETKVWIHEKNGSDAQMVGSPYPQILYCPSGLGLVLIDIQPILETKRDAKAPTFKTPRPTA
jgi:hypothetical protein